MDSFSTQAGKNPVLNRGATDEAEAEIDLLKLWRMLWPRKWHILGLASVTTLLAVLVVFSITPTYRAGATLLIEEQPAKVVSIEQVYGIEGAGKEYLQTQLELLKSRELAERVVRELKLTTHPEFDPRQHSGVVAFFQGLRPESLAPMTMPADLKEAAEAEVLAKAVDAFRERITIAPQGKSYLVKVQVEMADARMAARAANSLAKGFIDTQMEGSMSISLAASEWMSKRLGELAVNLKAAEDRLQAYREAENLIDVDGVATISASELSRTGDRLIDARRQRAEAESQYRQIASLKQDDWERLVTQPAVLSHPLVQQFISAEARARSKVEELSRRYGPRHPVMEAAQSELDSATSALRSQLRQVTAGIQSNYQLAVANEKSLEQSLNASKREIQEIARKEFRLRELQREVDVSRALYNTFMTRLRETSATADLKAANARIVDKAVVPLEPSSPRKGLTVLLTAFLSVLGGVGLVLLLDAINNTFKRPEQVEGLLNVPVLGVLPLMKGKERLELARLFTQGEDHRFSESIRTIRTGVVLSGMDHPHKVMVVTSSVPSEGKSTVSANLAFALGQMERVLLMDADLRRPTLAKSFEFPVGTPGLANLIAGTAVLEECIRRVDGIDVICAGAVPPNPLELLSSQAFPRLLEELKSRYDRIVIDSPPTQAVSDAIVLATHANTLLYVIRAAATPIPLVQKGVGQLLQNNAPVNGVVLNQLDVDKSQKYGYGSYYTYYGAPTRTGAD